VRKRSFGAICIQKRSFCQDRLGTNIGKTQTQTVVLGSAYLSFEESRSHVALWVLMAQPLHLGLDIRNVSTELLDMISNEEVLALHADPLGRMGFRATMSDGRMNGTQVWARELSDSSRLIGLLNLGGAENTFFGAIL
jgi:hypothetical protein